MRLIDADALSEKWKTVAECNCLVSNVVNACLTELNEQPTVEAAPVVHGEYIEDGYESCDGHYFIVCSKCGSEIPIKTANHIISNREVRFCYFCGAKMDGGSE